MQQQAHLNSLNIQGKRKRRISEEQQVDELNEVVVIGGGCDVVVVKKTYKVEVVKETCLKIIKMNELYEVTRLKMMLLSRVIDSQKTSLVPYKLLQDLIFAMRDFTDAYHQDIPGSRRLSDGSQLLVVDSEPKNILNSLRYIIKQLYPLVQRKPNYDESMLCHYECVLDLFDGFA